MKKRISANRATKKARHNAWLDDPNVVVFAGETELPVGAAEQHSIGSWAGTLFGRDRQDVLADWERVLQQMRFLLNTASAAAKGYTLNEITFQLGFSAEGKIVFVAKAGITTTISAKFTRTASEEG